MIPFLDLHAQYDSIADELEPAVLGVLRSGSFVLGPSVEKFEVEFADFCGTEYAVAVNSGTSALHIALLSLGIGPGDEVLTVPMTFVATVAAIRYTGARPVFVDIDPVTWTLDPRRVAAAVTERTKAIVPVHLHGQLADMTAICQVARKFNLTVVEDAAQAVGAKRQDRAGALADIGCFSFYPGKNLGACGEAGAITTNNEQIAATARSLRDWGQEGKYNHVREGFNYRMDGVQGAALRVKLKHIVDWNAGRRRVARQYDEGIYRSVAKPKDPFQEDHACHIYAVRVTDRARIQADLAERGIATGIHYPVPVHLQPAYRTLGYGPGDFPQSEALASETLSLPIYPEMTSEQVSEVIGSFNSLIESRTTACV